MSERITMNSKSLQGKFPQIYGEVFSKCPIVVSTPGNFAWSGEYTVMYGGVAIVQNIPLRFYIGLEPIREKKLVINDINCFNNNKGCFEERFLEDEFKAKYQSIILQTFPNLLEKSGFILHQLSEIPEKRGMNASSAMAASIAFAFYLQQRLVNSQTIENWSKLKSNELVKDRYFNKVFRLAWKIDSVLHADCGSGRGDFASLSATAYPQVYFSQKRKGSYSSHPLGFLPSDLEGHYEILDKINYWGYKINDFLSIEFLPTWPIDFGLIYSGYEVDTYSTLKSIPNIKEELNKAALLFTNLIEKKASFNKNNLPVFYEFCKKEKGEGFWDEIIKVAGIVSLQVLRAFNKLYRFGHSETTLYTFFKSLNDYQSILHLLGASSITIDNICAEIYDRGKNLDAISGIGAKISGGGKGGEVLFAAPISIFRQSIMEMISEFQKKYNKNISLDYASWIDGFELEGAKIEQDLESGQRSQFISQGTAIVNSYHQTSSSSRVISLEQMEKEKKNIDLLIDLENKNISVKGHKLTSKIIHSSTVTVEILRILLGNSGKKVSNKDLPKSSYTLERGELQSKIVTPLVKAVKQFAGKKLDFKITGGLTNFWIELNLDDLEVVLVEKII